MRGTVVALAVLFTHTPLLNAHTRRHNADNLIPHGKNYCIGLMCTDALCTLEPFRGCATSPVCLNVRQLDTGDAGFCSLLVSHR